MSNPIDMLTVNQSFMDVFAGAMVRTNVPVKAKFFNPQPKEKTAPVYPEIVVQPIAPTPDEFVWVDRQKQYNATDHTVTLTPPPIRSRFLFQVTMCSNRYDDALELMRLGLTAFKNEEGQHWITISDQRFDVFIQSIVPTPVIADGVFEDVFTYEVIVPLSLLPSKTVKAVTDFTIESTEGVEEVEGGGDEIKISIQS
jgi:hypothetical protein